MSVNADKALRDAMCDTIDETAARAGISSSHVAIRFCRVAGDFGWDVAAEKQERTRAEIRELLKDSPEELARVEAKFEADDQERARRVREKKP